MEIRSLSHLLSHVIDEEGMFILWLLARGSKTVAMMEREPPIPKTTIYRKVRELEERGWVLNEKGEYGLSERGRVLLRLKAASVVGAFYVETLYARAVKISVGGGWREALKVLGRCTENFVLTYETVAYLRTGFQTPSATFAYVLDEELGKVIQCSGGRRAGMADLVLIPVRELPMSEEVGEFRVVTLERLKLELLTWLGRGVLDLAALGEKIPERAPEV